MEAPNKYNSYEQLDFAVMSCRNDSVCVGIYDEDCDSYGPFLHVKRGFMRPSFDGPNCVYKKKIYHGKNISPPYSIITLPFQIMVSQHLNFYKDMMVSSYRQWPHLLWCLYGWEVYTWCHLAAWELLSNSKMARTWNVHWELLLIKRSPYVNLQNQSIKKWLVK